MVKSLRKQQQQQRKRTTLPRHGKKKLVWIAASTLISAATIITPCASFSPTTRRRPTIKRTEMEAFSFRRRSAKSSTRMNDNGNRPSSASTAQQQHERQQPHSERKVGFRHAIRSVFRTKASATDDDVTVVESSLDDDDIDLDLDDYTAFLLSRNFNSKSFSSSDDDFIRHNFEVSTPILAGLPQILGHESQEQHQQKQREQQEQQNEEEQEQSPLSSKLVTIHTELDHDDNDIQEDKEDLLQISKSKNGFKFGSIRESNHNGTSTATATATVTPSTTRSRKLWLFGWKGMMKNSKEQLDLVHPNNNTFTGLLTFPSKKKQQHRRHRRRLVSSDVLGTHRWLQNGLKERLFRWSKVDPVNLDIEAIPRGSIVKNLCKGLYCTNIHMKFDQLTFGNIQVTGGGHIAAKRLAINLFGGGSPRFPKQFDFHATNCTFTEKDLFESSCIRNGLANLLVRILNNINIHTTKNDASPAATGNSNNNRNDPATVKVTQVKILPSNKISILGEATTILDSRVSFEVRSGISTSSRGHIVTFPGLEVSLNPALGVFMPVVPDIDLDIGHNAQIKYVNVDYSQKHLRLSARVSITPAHTVRLGKYIQSNDAYLANFHFDVGKWLTRIGRFAN